MRLRNQLLLVAIATFAVASGAHAATTFTTSSEFLHQAGAGQIEVTPSLPYISDAWFYKPGATSTNKLNMQGFVPSVLGEYGIDPMISVGLGLAYEALSTSVKASSPQATSKQSGLENPDLFIKAHTNFGDNVLYYGAHLSISPGHATTDTDGNQNGYSGGTTLTPFIGYETVHGANICGAKLSYDLLKTNALIDVSGTSGTVNTDVRKGENELWADLFYERVFNSHLKLGGALMWQEIAEYKDYNSSGTQADDISSQSYLYLQAYAPYELNENTVILPSLQYGFYMHDNRNQNSYLSSISKWQMTIAARFAF